MPLTTAKSSKKNKVEQIDLGFARTISVLPKGSEPKKSLNSIRIRMKNKSRIAFRSLLLCSMALSSHHALADNLAALQTAEASVKTFESKGQTASPSYVYQLIRLANAYKANDQRKEADETYRKAIEIGSTIKNFDVPSTMMNWAKSLTYRPQVTRFMTPAESKDYSGLEIAYRADLQKAEEVVAEGLKLVSKLPTNSTQRLSFMVSAIGFYKSLGKQREMYIVLRSFDALIDALGSTPKLSNEEAARVAKSLIAVSQFLCESPSNTEYTAMATKDIVQDSEPFLSPSSIRLSKFKAGEKYELRAITFYDKLPESDQRRIAAHRRLAKWYAFFKQTDQEKAQTQILSKLLHSTDKNVLFPAKDPCYGCGRG